MSFTKSWNPVFEDLVMLLIAGSKFPTPGSNKPEYSLGLSKLVITSTEAPAFSKEFLRLKIFPAP